MSKIIGIDLGTTNSLVAVIENGRPKIIPDNNGERLIPSVVGISREGELLVGTPAKNQYIAEPENTIRSIKRKMGREERVSMGGREYTPQEISAFILRKLKKMAEDYLGEKVEKAVITVPAYFSDSQRQATKDAGEISGLEVVRIINEPTAAALAYGIDKELDQFVLVYDLGGGTFDVSVIELSSGVIEVRASHGNNLLGGDDFDKLVMDYLAEEFIKKEGIDPRVDRKALARITKASEMAKIELSDRPYTKVIEEFIVKKGPSSKHLKMELSRERLEELIFRLVDSTLRSIDIVLNDAGLDAKQIDKILLVGGSTRIPLVFRIVEEKMGKEPHIEVNPEECVALGAAIQAGIISGEEEVSAVLVDVTPYSLGIETASIVRDMMLLDQYSILIRKNTAIPVSKSEVYVPLHEEQKKAHIRVYQGESPIASKNVPLGDFMFEDLRGGKEGELPRIIVQFDFDVNGILHVSATNKDTGRSQKITISHSKTRLSSSEKEEARLKIVDLERQKQEKYYAMIKKAQRLMEDLEDKEDAEEVVRLVNDLQDALKKENYKKADHRMEELVDLMYRLER